MSKYIDAEKLKRFVGELKERAKRNRCDSWGIVPDALEEVEGFITSLQQECEIVEFSFKGGTYRVNGEEHALKGGKAKVIILEINQEEENV